MIGNHVCPERGIEGSNPSLSARKSTGRSEIQIARFCFAYFLVRPESWLKLRCWNEFSMTTKIFVFTESSWIDPVGHPELVSGSELFQDLSYRCLDPRLRGDDVRANWSKVKITSHHNLYLIVDIINSTTYPRPVFLLIIIIFCLVWIAQRNCHEKKSADRYLFHMSSTYPSTHFSCSLRLFRNQSK